MRVVFTEPALEDLKDMRVFLVARYPDLVVVVRKSVRDMVKRLAKWPESSPVVAERPEVRSAVFAQYPYKIFYRITPKRIEILHIRHSSRDSWT